MKKYRTAYLVQEVAGRNFASLYTLAERVVTLMPPGVQIVDGSATAAMMRTKMTDFFDNDVVVAAGDPAAIGIACVIAATCNLGKFTVLKWDREERTYYPVVTQT